VKLDPEARAEVGGAMRWYDDDNRDLGEAFLTEVERVFQRIEAMPLTFAVLGEDDRIRRAVVRRFPYVVYFVLLTTGEPRIIAVAHGKKRHMYWAERL
jgi:plasmid stabilization system protein ParE